MNRKTHLIKSLLLFALCAMLQFTAQAQFLNDIQKDNFRKEVEKLMKAYTEMATFTTNDVSVDINLINRFRNSFIQTTKSIVFNDLLPLKGEGKKFVSPVQYTQYVQRFYREGVDIQFTVEDIIFEPLPTKDGTYTAIVKANKKVYGLYNANKIHNFAGTIYLYVDAKFSENRPDNLLISLIANSDKHAQVQSSKQVGGLYAGVSGQLNQSMFLNPTILSNSTWQSSLGQGIAPSLDVFYMINKSIGVGTGIRFGSYASKLSISGYDKQLSSTITDVDGDQYNPIFKIPELNELSLIKTMDIPIALKLRAGKGITSFYFDIGAIYSMFSKATYTLDGRTEQKGYYPAYNVTLEDIPEYNFTSEEYRSEVKDMDVPDSGISAFFSLGMNINVYTNIHLRVGLSGLFMLTDLEYKQSRYPFDFYATTGLAGDKTNILSAGLEIGLYYRVFSGF